MDTKTIRSHNLLRERDPVRCEVFFRNLRGMGVHFDVDRAAGRVTATIDGEEVDPVLQVEVRARAWWLLEQVAKGDEGAADGDMETQ